MQQKLLLRAHVSAHYGFPVGTVHIPFGRNLGIPCTLSSFLHVFLRNGNGTCCNVHVRTGRNRLHEMKVWPYRNRSIHCSRAFSPKGLTGHHKTCNAPRKPVSPSFCHKSLTSPFTNSSECLHSSNHKLPDLNEMSFAWKIQNSRNQWKKKATARANSDRENRKAIKRKNRLIASQKRRIRDLENENAELKKRAIGSAVKNKTHLIFISLLLFTEARIGFRAIARVLSTLKGVLGIAKAPCGQTVINWVIKLSLVRTSTPLSRAFCPSDRFSNGWVFMMDESIGHSGGKILAILAVRSNHYASASGHPSLADVRCAGVAVSDSWTGESVSAFLRRVIAVTGRPVVYVKDGGGNLKKACSLLEADGLGSPTLSDISHVSANLLKSAYGEHPDLEGFLSSCGNAASRLKQTVLTCLAPPKIRMKSRFMNLHRLVGWAEDALLLHTIRQACATYCLFLCRVFSSLI